MERITLTSHTLDDESLSWYDRVLIEVIHALDKSERGCYASDETLAKMTRSKSSRSTANRISFLVQAQKLERITNRHNDRQLRSKLHPKKQLSQNCESSVEDSQKNESSEPNFHKKMKVPAENEQKTTQNGESNFHKNVKDELSQICEQIYTSNKDDYLNTILNTVSSSNTEYSNTTKPSEILKFYFEIQFSDDFAKEVDTTVKNIPGWINLLKSKKRYGEKEATKATIPNWILKAYKEKEKPNVRPDKTKPTISNGYSHERRPTDNEILRDATERLRTRRVRGNDKR